jgi:hypothetical protein
VDGFLLVVVMGWRRLNRVSCQKARHPLRLRLSAGQSMAKKTFAALAVLQTVKDSRAESVTRDDEFQAEGIRRVVAFGGVGPGPFGLGVLAWKGNVEGKGVRRGGTGASEGESLKRQRKVINLGDLRPIPMEPQPATSWTSFRKLQCQPPTN